MNLGITGTREGLTSEQRQAFCDLLHTLGGGSVDILRHGSCKGADVEAARLARSCLGLALAIIAHPGPDNDHCRMFSGVDNETLPGLTHFARNRQIVDLSDRLVAFPVAMQWGDRGGTKYTHDYAVKKRKMVYVIWPDGTLTEEAGQ